MRVTGENIVHAIGLLPKSRTYNYINPETPTQLRIMQITYPEGPIYIKRWDPTNGETFEAAKQTTISKQMIWRVANACVPNQPLNFDRILGGSYNTRSALEALMAYTPEFYFCKPGRIQIINERTTIEEGHKHLVWRPDQPHQIGIHVALDTEIGSVSEVPMENVYASFDSLDLKNALIAGEMDIDTKRRHTQIQIALIEIGKQLGFRTYIAQNDMGIKYKDKKIGEMETVVPTLQNERIMNVYTEAAHAARLIDCIWFKNGALMPAVMEVEHSTGVTSGLERMLGLYNHIKGFNTRYVIVAADEDRGLVLREAQKEQYRVLNTRFFPYSAVEELYFLCNKRKIRGVTEEFLDCYMEPAFNMLQ